MGLDEWLVTLPEERLKYLYKHHTQELKNIHDLLDEFSVPTKRADGLVYDVETRVLIALKDYAYGKELNEACLAQQTNPHTCTESNGMVLGIGYDIHYDRYYMIQQSEVPMAINYCPWCGQKLDAPAGTPEPDSEADEMESWKAGGWKEGRQSIRSELERVIDESRDSLNPYHADKELANQFGLDVADMARSRGIDLLTTYYAICQLLQAVTQKMRDTGRV